jgi:general secretion pathway protein J
MTPHSRPRLGFTLIEVLVALLIMSVLAVLGWRGIDSMARSREVAQSSSERSLRLSAIAAQFEADLLAVEDTNTTPAGLAFDGASLRMTRRTDLGLQVVVWSLREGVWWRWAGASSTSVAGLQESWLASHQLLGNEPQQIHLLDGVSGWQIYFYVGGAWTNAQSTGKLVAGQQLLPQGVRLVIELPEGKLTRDIALRTQ